MTITHFGSSAGSSTASATGTIEVSGGRLFVLGTANCYFTAGNSGSSHGSFIQTGGLVQIDTTNDSRIRIGHWAHSGIGSLYRLTGGELRVPNALFNVGVDARGTFEMTGGKALLKGLKVSGSEPGALSLLGGTLTLGSGGIAKTTAATSTPVTFGDVTFGSAASWTLVSTLPAILSSSDVEKGTLFAPSEEDTITLSSVLSGSGRLVVAGPGTVKLAAINTYTGGTELRGGTLAVTAAGQIPAGGEFVATGGVLDTGNTAPVISVTGLALDGIGLRLPLTGFPEAGLFTVTGGGMFTVGENGVAIQVSGGMLPDGSHTLVSGFSNTLTDEDLSRFTVEHDLDTNIFSIDLKLEGNAVRLIVEKLPGLFWANSSGGIWSTDSEARNWLNLSGEAVAFADGEKVYFEEIENAESITVDVAGSVVPDLLFFRNSEATDYVLTGSGEISGTTGLTKTLAGTVRLENHNTFTGDTLIGGGKLIVSGSLGTPNEPYPGEITVSEGAVFSVDSDVDQLYSGLFTGTGTFEKAGSGELVLPRFGAVPASLSVVGGGLTVVTTDDVMAFAMPISLTAPGMLSLLPVEPLTIDADISGDGVLAVSEGSVSINQPQAYFRGQLQVTGGTVTLNAGSSSTHGSGSGIFGDSIYKTNYPVFISGPSTVVVLGVNEVSGWHNNQVGYRFAEMTEGATLRKVGQTQNLMREFLFSGNANLVNEHATEGWKLGPGAVLRATAGVTVFSGTASTPGAILVNGTAANNRVYFDVASGAEIRFDTEFTCIATANSGIRKTGEGILCFKKPVVNNVPTEIDEGTLALDAVVTGSGSYRIGNGSSAATLCGSGSLNATGLVTVKANAAIETGLTVNNLLLESGSAVSVREDAAVLTVASLSASGTVNVDLSGLDLETVSLPLTIVEWSGPEPDAVFELSQELGGAYALEKTPGKLRVGKRSGVNLMLY